MEIRTSDLCFMKRDFYLIELLIEDNFIKT